MGIDEGLDHNSNSMVKLVHKTSIGTDETTSWTFNDSFWSIWNDLKLKNKKSSLICSILYWIGIILIAFIIFDNAFFVFTGSNIIY